MVSLTEKLLHHADISDVEMQNFHTLRDKFSGSDVQVNPWPFFEVDNILPPDLYAQVLENWPEEGSFNTLPSLVAGQSMCYLIIEDGRQPYHMDDARTEFWDGFVRDWAYPLILANIEKYAWIVACRFGGEVSMLSTQTLNLMQHRDEYTGQDSHNHYNHNVNWLFTFLLYIGDETDPGSGTGIHTFDSNDWYLNYHSALQATVPFGSPIDNTHLVYRSEFKGNKLVSMIDSPVSLHSGTPPGTAPEGINRRIIRFHVGVPNPDIERVYGFTRQEFFAHFANKELSPGMLDSIRRDIDVSRLATNREKFDEMQANASLSILDRPPPVV